MGKQIRAGHLAAILTILIWGTTFISTKILLTEFLPAEILLYRFLVGYLILWLVYPHWSGMLSTKREFVMASAGLCGVTLYYLLENIALTYTLTSNVSVIVSVSPFLTAILVHVLKRTKERIPLPFIAGFLVAMAGIALISFNGSVLMLHPAGDLLSLGAAAVWACYSVLAKKIGTFGLPLIAATRRIFFYGILFMLPAFFFSGATWDPQRFAHGVNLFNFLYLGIGACALCFVIWNYAVKTLGPVRTSIYLYLVPIVTVITSMFVLKEPLTPLSVTGLILTVAGLFLSERPAHAAKAPPDL